MPVKVTEEMLEKAQYSIKDVAKLFMEFYEKVKHGDEEHQKWLRDEVLNFIGEEILKTVSDEKSNANNILTNS